MNKNFKLLSTLIKDVNKSSLKKSTSVSFGFNDPDTWISTGSYALNYIISKDFNAGIPLGKVSVFAGESGAGKSYIVSGNIARNAQKQGIHVVMIDTENALDDQWLTPLGVNTSPEALTKVNMAKIDDVSYYISEFVKGYRSAFGDVPKEERLKVLFIVDSLGMLLTQTNIDQFTKGDLKGDMGSKPKQLKALVTNCVNMFGDLNIGLVATNHTYDSQDMFDPDPKVSGGSGFVYASSMMIAMGKHKLKIDEDGNKTTKVQGIRAKCKIMKSRYNKPFEEVELLIPYNTGMNPYSGLFTLFLNEGLLVRSGNSYIYVDTETGNEIKHFEKGWNRNDGGCLDLVMKQFKEHPIIKAKEKTFEYQDEDFGTDIDLDNVDDIPDDEIKDVVE